MQTRLIDEAGHITLPPELRLHPGDTLELETEDGAITLRPAKGLWSRQFGFSIQIRPSPLRPRII